jgi:hypothetical protein
MDDNEKSACKCNQDSNNIQFISGVIAYELAVIIILLIFILWGLDEPCERSNNSIEQLTENS